MKTELLQKIKELKRPSFMSIKGYRNAKGEVSNYLINVGVSYPNMVKRDMEKLENASFPDVNLEQARKELLSGMQKNKDKKTQSNQSKAQQSAYFSPCDGVRLHIKKMTFYVSGIVHSKEVISGKQESEEKSLSYKDEVKKALNLSSHKIRQFKIEEIEDAKVNGERFVVQAKKGLVLVFVTEIKFLRL